jgi:hypothetical protein
MNGLFRLLPLQWQQALRSNPLCTFLLMALLFIGLAALMLALSILPH